MPSLETSTFVSGSTPVQLWPTWWAARILDTACVGVCAREVVELAHSLSSIVGDTVNVSSRMESNSDKNRIHLSDTSTKLLRKQAPELRLESRGLTHIKGEVTG
jgi:class 3 adenylate cyclase